MTVPGLFYVTAKITSPELSPQLLTRWFNDVHAPDILNTSGVQTAFRYMSIDPSAERPYLTLLPVRDIDFLKSDEFNAVPNEHPMLPGPKHSLFDLADGDRRYFEHVQTYEGVEGKGTKAGPAELVIVAAAIPVDVADFDKWYRNEHLEAVSKCTGYRRTRRYKLADAAQRGSSEQTKLADLPSYLALHEFDGELPGEQLQKTAETKWSEKCWGGAQKKEMAVYKLLKGFGDVDAFY